MHELLSPLVHGLTLTGDVRRDVPAFLAHYGCRNTAAHSARVADEARRIAALVGVDVARAELAGWLHDVSAVYPGAERARVARALGLEVLPEEDAYPPILHQKLSACLAREVFGVGDEGVLSAVGCHTTLRADATALDMALFVADKLAWDQPGEPPYRKDVLSALDRSLDEAALAYLRYLWERRQALAAVHPWLRAAYEQLSGARQAGHNAE